LEPHTNYQNRYGWIGTDHVGRKKKEPLKKRKNLDVTVPHAINTSPWDVGGEKKEGGKKRNTP